MKLVKKLVEYMPLLILVTVFLWPNIMTQFHKTLFPVFKIMGLSVRITEIFYYLTLFLTFMLILNPKRIRRKAPSLIFTKRIWVVYPYIFIGSIILILATIQGIINKNPKILEDFRGISYAGYTVLFIYYIKKIENFKKPLKFLFIGLVLLTVSNILTMFLDPQFNIGRITNITIMMTLFLLCLSLSFSIYLPHHKKRFITISIVTIIVCLISLQKQAFLGFLVALISSLVLIKKNKIKELKKVLIKIVVPFVLIVVFIIIKNPYNINSYLQTYYQVRVLREDNGFDISGGRFLIWDKIYEPAIKSPFIGKGMGPIGFKLPTISILVNEHNIILWAIHRFSFFGTIIFILLAVKFFIFSKSVFNLEKDPFKKALVFACLLYEIVFFFVNLVILLPFVFETALMFWFTGGIIVVIYREQLINNKLILTIKQ